MSLPDVIQQFFDTPAGTAVLLLFGMAVLDFLLGVFAAWRDDVFETKAVGAWIRKHIAGRVLPISAVLLMGHIVGGAAIDDGSDLLAPGTILMTIGIGASAIYVLECIGSIRESLQPKPGTRAVPTE
jgi:hypothetical protein